MLTLKDKLSHLTYQKARKLLGPNGDKLIIRGGKYDIDIDAQVSLTNTSFTLYLNGPVVSINHQPEAEGYLKFQCSYCGTICDHVGAAFSLILEEKLSLGLAAPPPEKLPIESLSEEALLKRALEERVERAQKEKMKLVSSDETKLWTDYTVTNSLSGKTYRVALRGWDRGESYCSCPDFRRNTLGTCKHLMFVTDTVKSRFSDAQKNTRYQRNRITVLLHYGKEIELRLLIPEDLDEATVELLKPIANKPIIDIHELLVRLRKLEQSGQEVNIYPDAEAYIEKRLFRQHLGKLVEEIRNDPKNHPLRTSLLKVDLLPYQLDGIAFAVGAGRAILADDMGLGKTIQGLGVAALLNREVKISKVLVVCPASLKSQWRNEIQRFSDFTCQIVLGSADERAEQYNNSAFFTLCNYEQVLRDFNSIERVTWDLIILDEGQRIKNWEAKTSRIVKSLNSPFALVLSGTPLENRLEELYSVVEFIDDRRLGPAFRFFNTHKVVSEKGRPLGYKNLDQLRDKLRPILLRRTRGMVIKELPPRSTEIIRVTPTEEQIGLHHSHRRIISNILRKNYISEMDLLRLQKALLMCRLAANSTFLVDKQEPSYSTKLEEFGELLSGLLEEDDRKIIVFSEWKRMLDLIEPKLNKHKVDYVRLDGSVPQKKRQGLMNHFQTHADCKLFITTNAGATGLNLQAANTIINVDLPWNPAILEQRIARAHRMGQKRPVQIYLLVSEGTIEESLLNTLAAKQDLALAALDAESQVSEVSLSSSIEDLKQRLEVLLGNKPDAPIDESQKNKNEAEAVKQARKKGVATAGGQLLTAAFAFMNEILSQENKQEETEKMASLFKDKLMDCMEKDDDGCLTMTVKLPDESALDTIASSLAGMVASRN